MTEPTYAVIDAAERVRAAIHAGAHHSAYEFPSQVYDTYGALATLTDRLPQAIQQTTGWITRETDRGGVAVVSGEYTSDPAAATAALEHHTDRAAAALRTAAAALHAAHAVAAALAAPTGRTGTSTREGGHD